MKKDTNKERKVSYHAIPSQLWQTLKKHLPKPAKQKGPGRPRVQDRDVINGIWYVLWTGCQWKAVKQEWFHVSSSTLHERFQEWTNGGIFDKLFKILVRYYARERHIRWKWQSVDSKMVPAPLGGAKTWKNPTDRGKLGANIHLLVDESGAPLAVHITGANEHDKWSVEHLVIHMAVKRPNGEQHLCGDKGYGYEDVRQFAKAQRYQSYINLRQWCNQPKVEDCPIPAEASFPARRWEVERTLGWLAKRRSIKIRWCKKPENLMAFLKLACSDLLHNLIFE